jgi:hypothetical protein
MRTTKEMAKKETAKPEGIPKHPRNQMIRRKMLAKVGRHLLQDLP